MQQADIPTLGSVADSSFGEQWNGARYTRLREEMREVFLTRSHVPYSRARFKLLEPFCVEPRKCFLKNMYFAHDEEFYGDLREALERVRAREVGWIGTPKMMLRQAEAFVGSRPRLRRWFHRLREASRPARKLAARLRRPFQR